MLRYLLQSLAVVMLLIGIERSFAAEIDISGVRFGKTGGATRVVLDISNKANPSVFLLADPYRVVIDLPKADWKAPANVDATGVVERFRHGLFTQDTYRIVLDLSTAATVKRSFYLSPKGKYGHRLVLDLQPDSRANFVTAVAKTKKKRVAPAPIITQAAPKRVPGGKRLVVIDAGHGGVDPGTLGVLGVNEKIITLNIAKSVAKALEGTGRYTVRMTRDKDIFIPVRKRPELARRMGADLFISIHADAIRDPSVRGGTVYTLSEKASDREAARLAARENKADLIAGLDLDVADDVVSGILIELAQRETMNYSAQFAEILLPEMRREVQMHARGHRFANLGVLKAPDMPSVLIEAGYLSNKTDARLMNSYDGRRRISRAIVRAVDKYFEQMLALGR